MNENTEGLKQGKTTGNIHKKESQIRLHRKASMFWNQILWPDETKINLD